MNAPDYAACHNCRWWMPSQMYRGVLWGLCGKGPHKGQDTPGSDRCDRWEDMDLDAQAQSKC
jgi:hypothetical protein